MPALEIIGVPQSNYVWAVRMVCEEKGVPYDYRPERPHSPAVDAIHPFGKVPVMRHGDVELCESKAIATYIDRALAGSWGKGDRLYMQGPWARGTANQGYQQWHMYKQGL